ncbi:hypothetical protein ACTHQY_08920 [Rhodococcoides corynebacterioides]|uniref:hypothetical protein n=1 Tax=Rhodococcoides corynebacterioides TaxID=53972 RepID=UPI003F7FA0A1
MPRDDEFDDITDPDADVADEPTEQEIEAARALLAKVTPPAPAGPGLKIPDHAPKPTDRQPKRSAVEKEARGETILISMFDEEFHIDRASLFDSWDWQVGVVQNNPLQMCKGLLGDRRFAWFCLNAQKAGMTPSTAATELIELFSAEAGFEKAGNS